MRIVTANIKNNPDMPDPQMRADISEVATLGEVIFLQEIGDAADHTAVRTSFPSSRWDVRQNSVEVPICVSRHHLEVLSSGQVQTHPGRAGITPDRFFSWVLTREIHRPKMPPVVFMNTHFISGAFNPDKDQLEWRKEMWLSHWRQMRAKIAEFNNLGYSVVFGGDFNKVRVDRFHAGQRWVVNTGIDKIGIVAAPHGAQVEIWGQDIAPVALNSDHDAKIANLAFKRPRG